MGTKWMIEQTIKGYAEWLTNNLEWSNDPHVCLQFVTREDAIDFRDNHEYIAAITEHIFMSPISTSENLN